MRLTFAFTFCTILLIAVSSLAAPPTENDPFAVRVEGYMGAAILDVDVSGVGSESGFAVGGAGSAVGLLGPVFLQLDLFGDYADLDFPWDAKDVGFGGHLGLVDAELGSVALTGGYQQFALDSNDAELWRVGGEAEGYLDAFTFGAQAGYERFGDTNEDGWYTRALVRFYPTENLKLEGMGGYAEIESDGLPQGRVLIEYRPEGFWLSVFTRWEGTFDLQDVLDSHAVVAGVRFYWDRGLSLRASDRVYFRESCTNVNIYGGRVC